MILVVLPATLGDRPDAARSRRAWLASDDADIGRDAGPRCSRSNTLGAIGGTFVDPVLPDPDDRLTSLRCVVLALAQRWRSGLGLLSHGTDLARAPRRVAASRRSCAGRAGRRVALVVPQPARHGSREPPGSPDPRCSSPAPRTRSPRSRPGRKGDAASTSGSAAPAMTAADGGREAHAATCRSWPGRDPERMLVDLLRDGLVLSRPGSSPGSTVDGVELVPSVPSMFGFYYPDAAQVLANTEGPPARSRTAGTTWSSATGPTTSIVVDPPPPIESSGTVGPVLARVLPGRGGRLTPGGVMMEWMPVRRSRSTSSAPTSATFHEHRSRTSSSRSARPARASTCSARRRRSRSTRPTSRSVLERAGVLDDLVTTPDAPVTTADAWATTISNLALDRGRSGHAVRRRRTADPRRSAGHRVLPLAAALRSHGHPR